MLEEESILFGKRAYGGEDSRTFLTLVEVPVFFQNDRQQVDISDVRLDYDQYCNLSVSLKPASGINLDAVFDQDLL